MALGPRNQGLQFQPFLGQVLVCDFNTGFQVPEMVKIRPVVVVSPQPRTAKPLVSVVPLSTQRPNPVEPFHHLLPAGLIPVGAPGQEAWAKCDMVTTVSLHRLDRIKVGFRQFVAPILPPAEIAHIQRCLLHALAMHQLTPHL